MIGANDASADRAGRTDRGKVRNRVNLKPRRARLEIPRGERGLDPMLGPDQQSATFVGEGCLRVTQDNVDRGPPDPNDTCLGRIHGSLRVNCPLPLRPSRNVFREDSTPASRRVKNPIDGLVSAEAITQELELFD